jgi:hypothetical protein
MSILSHVYICIRPYTPLLVYIILRQCTYTCLHTSAPMHLYMFTSFYVHKSHIHVYVHLGPYTYAHLYTTTAIYLHMLRNSKPIYIYMLTYLCSDISKPIYSFTYFYAHIPILVYILLHLYACMYVHVHYFEFVNVTIFHATQQ